MRYFRKITQGLLLAAACTLSLFACSAPQGNGEQGQRWFVMNNCVSCHGAHAIDGRAASLAGIEMSFGRFEGYLRDPASPSMPKYPESKVSRQDAADI